MKTLMTILAAGIIVTCQNLNAQPADYGDANSTSAIVAIGEELQKKFEEEAFAVVMNNTKRLTDAVVLENSRWLSEFAKIRRHIRVAPEFGQVSGQSMEFGEAHKEFFKWVLPPAREMNTVRFCTFPN